MFFTNQKTLKLMQSNCAEKPCLHEYHQSKDTLFDIVLKNRVSMSVTNQKTFQLIQNDSADKPCFHVFYQSVKNT